MALWSREISAGKPVAYEGQDTLMLKSAVCLGSKSVLKIRAGGTEYCLCSLTADAPNAVFTVMPVRGVEFLVQGAPVSLLGNLEPNGFSESETESESEESQQPKASPASAPKKSPTLNAKAKAGAAPASKSPMTAPKSPPLGAQFKDMVQAKKRQAEEEQPAKKTKVETKAEPKAAPKPDAKETQLAKRRLPSGVVYEVVGKGQGGPCRNGQKIWVKYCGRLAKGGKQFDKGTIDFRLGAKEVIAGWDEGVKGMMRGEKRKLFIPAVHAYGRRGAPPDIPPNADLIFDVEMMKMN